MGQAIAEKVFSMKMGRPVRPGEYVVAPVDCAMLHEAFVLSWMQLMAAGVRGVWDPDKVVVVLDHYVPAATERMATAHKMIRDLAHSIPITAFYDEGEGIGHQVMMEKGHARPGALIVGTDSHTCTYGALAVAGVGIGTTEMAYVLARGELWFKVPETIRFVLTGRLADRVSAKDIILHIAGTYGTEVGQYRAVEFTGDGAHALSVESRMAICNMAVEIGAKFGFFAVDEKTLAYLNGRMAEPPRAVTADPDARYEATYEVAVDGLGPQVACPHSVGNVKPVGEVQGTPVQQAVLGSCTNGRYEDLAAAAELLGGRRVAPRTRLYVFPASREVYHRAMETGVLRTLSEAGAIVCNATCGPCFGAQMGMLAPGEACISSTNRNFRGRMGSAAAEIYLASPATVAASAVAGAITDPREV